MIARSIYAQDIIQIRWITLLLLILSHVIFVTGIVVYFKSFINIKVREYTTLLALSILGQFILWMPVQFIPSYWIFNYVVILCSLGFLLISFNRKNDLMTYSFSFITGFLIGFIPVIMITNIPFILLMLIVAYVHLKPTNKKHFIFYFISFFIGTVATLVVYFSLIQNFNAFISNFRESINHLNYDQTHGLIPMIKWVIRSIQYLSNEILILSLVIILSDLFVKKQSYLTLKIFISIVLITAISFMIFDAILLSNEMGIFSPSIFLVLFFVLLYKNIHIKVFDHKILWIFLTLILMPFIASLGTNVPFILRGVAYVSVIFVSIYILIIFINEVRYKVIFTLFLFIATINFLRLPFIPGWTYQVLSEQRNPVRNLGISQNILIDDERYQILEKLKSILPDNDFVIVSHRSFWGYVYLLELKIPYLYFDFSENLFLEQFRLHHKDINDFAFIELSTVPFPSGFFDRLKSVGYDEDKFQKINITDQIVVYKNRNEN
jgi:hypothetical protein